MANDLSDRVARMRDALLADPESLDYAQLPAPADPVPDLPGRLSEVYALSNGPRCGSVICFPTGKLARNQFYCDEVGGAQDWLCFGVNSDDPLFVRRDTGEVWWFRATGTERSIEQFERLTADAVTFFEDSVFGPGYRALSGADQWYELLRGQGLAD